MGDGNLILSQITGSALVVLLIQKLKSAKWVPFISQKSDGLNRLLAALGAMLSSIGVHATFDHSSGVLTITGLTLMGILTGIWHWGNSLALQELMYRGTVRPYSWDGESDRRGSAPATEVKP